VLGMRAGKRSALARVINGRKESMWCLEGDAMRCCERTEPDAPVALCRRMLASRHSLKFLVNVRTISGLFGGNHGQKRRDDMQLVRTAATARMGGAQRLGKSRGAVQTHARGWQRVCSKDELGQKGRLVPRFFSALHSSGTKL
jgi:hypothetical protein